MPGTSVPWEIGLHLRLLRCLTGNQNTLFKHESDHIQICLKIHHGNRVFLCGGLFYKKIAFYQSLRSINEESLGRSEGCGQKKEKGKRKDGLGKSMES